jgi:hypothetical protein
VKSDNYQTSSSSTAYKNAIILVSQTKAKRIHKSCKTFSVAPCFCFTFRAMMHFSARTECIVETEYFTVVSGKLCFFFEEKSNSPKVTQTLAHTHIQTHSQIGRKEYGFFFVKGRSFLPLIILTPYFVPSIG